MYFKQLFKVLLVINILVMLGCTSPSTRKNHRKKTENLYTIKFNPVSTLYVKAKRDSAIQFFQKTLGDEQFNGMFLFAKNGKILYEKTNGYVNYSKKNPLTSQTPIHIASVSKVATCLAIMRLVDAKKTSLETDIRKYLPTLPYEGITIRQLLNHRSGIPYYGYFTEGKWNKSKFLNNDQIVNILAKHKIPLNFPSNTRFAYSNTNYSLLALIIEKITRLNFPKAMDSILFQPLKMNDTYILSNPKKINQLSPSYNSNFVLQPVDFLDGIYGDKNMYSTTRDLLKLDMATYSPIFLSIASRKEIYQGYSYEKKGTRNYGLGVRMVEVAQKKTYFFHTGWWHGNTSCYATLRKDTVCIIALSNKYSRKVYQIHQLSKLFKGYPFEK
jgi:CubicO group peptidase (beta-lactamase class C family)